MADNDETDLDAEAPKKAGKGKLIMFAVIGLALVGGGAFAVPMVMKMINPPPPLAEGEGEPEIVVDNSAALYYPIMPPITTNFSDDVGRRRFMQVTLEVRTQDQKVIDAVKDHSAMIRNALLMAYSDVKYSDATTREGKEALRALSLAEVQAVMTEQIGEPGIDDIFFTSFVVQ